MEPLELDAITCYNELDKVEAKGTDGGKYFACYKKALGDLADFKWFKDEFRFV